MTLPPQAVPEYRRLSIERARTMAMSQTAAGIWQNLAAGSSASFFGRPCYEYSAAPATVVDRRLPVVLRRRCRRVQGRRPCWRFAGRTAAAPVRLHERPADRSPRVLAVLAHRVGRHQRRRLQGSQGEVTPPGVQRGRLSLVTGNRRSMSRPGSPHRPHLRANDSSPTTMRRSRLVGRRPVLRASRALPPCGASLVWLMC